VNFSRNQVLSLLSRIEMGQLIVTDIDGSVTTYGSSRPKEGFTKTEFKVLRETFWVRLLLFADMVRDARKPLEV